MAISGRSYPNHPIVLKAEGVQVVGTQAIVVTTQPDRRFYVYNKGTRAEGSGVVTDMSPDPTPIVVAAPRRKILAPQPIIITAPFEAPATPGSPPTVPLVFPGPDPRRTTKPPFILIGVAGAPPSPTPPADVAWCAQSPITGWIAQTPFTDWEADTPLTNWMVTKPVEDC